MAEHGGRIPPDNRGTSAPGVGKNSKRHDLERRSVPFLAGSDLQQGDVQALRDGQRVAPKQTQQPAVATGGQSPPRGNNPPQAVSVPDPIDFLGARAQGLGVPISGTTFDGGQFEQWRPIIEKIVNSSAASGGLAAAWINQLRSLRNQKINRPTTVVDLQDIDNGLEAMLNEGI